MLGEGAVNSLLASFLERKPKNFFLFETAPPTKFASWGGLVLRGSGRPGLVECECKRR